MCNSTFYLMENTKNTNSSARSLCVERCPVFYTGRSFKSLDPREKSKYEAETGNDDQTDAVRNNAKARTEYEKAKKDFKEGKVT